ncbi:MAG: hypothetical protein ACXVIM_12390 [Acidimicrobiia bacterium]
MIRRFAIAATAVAIASGGLLATGSTFAGAAKPAPFDASGAVHCTGPGKVKLSPPLTNTPAAGTRTINGKFLWNCTNGGAGSPTGNPAVTVRTGKMTVTASAPGSDTCSTLLGTSPTTFTTDTKWKSSGGKVNPSHIVWSNVNGTSTGFDLPGTGGTSTVTGSYAGENATAHAAISSAELSALASKCSGKGIKVIHFAPSSTLDLS